MIDPKTFVTYAQNREDLILAALLKDVKSGFYVDVGAAHPVIDSVTKYFYDLGWSGINIEPIKRLHKLFNEQRPRDINLNCGVGAKETTITLREYIGMEGRSTFSDAEKQEYAPVAKYKEYPVKMRTLEGIFDEVKPAKMHFLKIDVEGYEYEVLSGNNWERYRPELICIEANRVAKECQSLLADKNYKNIFFDGLNEYYLATEALTRLGSFNFAKNVVDKGYYALRYHHYQAWLGDLRTLARLEKLSDRQKSTIQYLHREIDQKDQELQQMARLSLLNKPLRQRLKISLVGLSTDWLKFKKINRQQKRPKS